MWPFVLSDRLLIVALVGRYPANWLISRGPLLHQIALFLGQPCGCPSVRGISDDFSSLSPCEGQVIHVLLTRSPLTQSFTLRARLLPQSAHREELNPSDLHVLGTPPAFILSQDQTLMFVYLLLLHSSSLCACYLFPISSCSSGCYFSSLF